jgi:NodT family efflux transporter outer membrane factor (OMF) lipoprotein
MKRLPLPLAAALLAGCMNLQPGYERPAAPIASTFPNAAPNEVGTPPSQLRWADFFTGDARLQRLIALALANNRDLRVAAANIEQARALITVRRADQLPTVGVGVQAERTSGQPSLYSAGLAFSAFELDLFGRIRSLTDVALAQYLASEEARKAAHIALVASVANAHYVIAADDELLALARRTLQTRRDTLKLTQLRVDNGAASEFDLRLSQTQVEAARIVLAQQQRQRELDVNALTLLVGAPLPAELPAAPTWNAAALSDVPAGLPSQVLLQRPDVLQAEQQLIAANANIGAARAAFWPRISLTASAGTASTHLSDLFKDFGWSFAPQLFQPLFDSGRNDANLKIAQAQRDSAVAQYERAVQAAFRDVADALGARAALNEQLDAARAQAQAEEARFKLSQLRFDAGVTSSFELLDAQRSLFAAQQLQLQTELAVLLNRVAAYRALGGGWNEVATR